MHDLYGQQLWVWLIMHHNNNNNSCVKTKLTLDLKPYKRHLAKNVKREKNNSIFLSLSLFLDLSTLREIHHTRIQNSQTATNKKPSRPASTNEVTYHCYQ